MGEESRDDVTFDDVMTMCQSKYLDHIISKFDLSDSHPKPAPCDPSFSKEDFENSPLLENSKLYREIIGSLIYVMTATRPDICFVVTKLSQSLSKPTIAHLNAAKSVLKYLKGTSGYKLSYHKQEEDLNLFGFCDSDWASSQDRRSISGYCFFLHSDGPLISWQSKKQYVRS